MNTKTSIAALVTRQEIDQQVQTAKQFPRSIRNFLDDCRQMVTLDETIAGECMYSMPKGGKMIEGPSSRFAEIALSSWGNCRAGARVVHEDLEFITAQGIFQDLERNTAVTFEVRRRITDSNGNRYNQDMVNITGNAASSIALRNAVLKGIPKAFWHQLYEEARRTAMGDAKTLATRRVDAINFLARFGATEQMIYDTLGVRGQEEITLEHLAQLRGMATAIKDGDATVETLFGGPQTTEQKSVESLKSGIKKREWPKKITDKETGEEHWIDSREVVLFNHEVHGTSGSGIPAVTKDGHFTKRRGCSPKTHAEYEKQFLEPKSEPEAEEQPETETKETQQATTDNLESWARMIHSCRTQEEIDEVQQLVESSKADMDADILQAVQQLIQRQTSEI